MDVLQFLAESGRVRIHVKPFSMAYARSLSDDGTPVLVAGEDVLGIRQIANWLQESPVVALVCDYDGLRTYQAIRAGADSVLNLAIPAGAQARVLFAANDEPAAFGDHRSIPELVTPLMRLLCGDETIGAIARRSFCSERTMYRRIRALYDRLGVANRCELRDMVARLDLAAEGAGADRARAAHRV